MADQSRLEFLKNAPRGCKQEAVRQHYKERGFNDNPLVTLPGLIEEVGEIATALMAFNPLYIGRPDKEYGNVEHEALDVLVYLCAICNHMGIDLGI
jgi:NTP pyrophosphatase (non-canonical NTP hydrolase)